MNDELYDKYKADFEKDFKVDAFNLEKVALELPSRKHFWVARLHDLKRRRYKLELSKKTLENEVLRQMQDKSPVKLDKGVTSKIRNNSSMQELSEELKNLDMVIAWLDDAVRIITFMSNDVKNIIEIKKLEEQ